VQVPRIQTSQLKTEDLRTSKKALFRAKIPKIFREKIKKEERGYVEKRRRGTLDVVVSE